MMACMKEPGGTNTTPKQIEGPLGELCVQCLLACIIPDRPGINSIVITDGIDGWGWGEGDAGQSSELQGPVGGE